MTLEFEPYLKQLAAEDPACQQILSSCFHEAARLMSPQGLHNYIVGGCGLKDLNRGMNLVLSYYEALPTVVNECGEDLIPEVVEAALKMASMTSGEVIALVFASLPTATRRLGDGQLVRSYLQFLHLVGARAPRALRPLLNNIDELLGKLTLTGLRRWAQFGIDAYRRDLTNLVNYFNLTTRDSLSVLQRERRGTLFVDSQRKINYYLRALWGRDFLVRPCAADLAGFKPFIEQGVLHLPDAVDDIDGTSGLDLYRAQVAHMAAHGIYRGEPLSAQMLSPAQMFFIGLIEDARVEMVAIDHFPGLQKLWFKLLSAPPSTAEIHPTVTVLEHYARMLLSGQFTSTDEALNTHAHACYQAIRAQSNDSALAWSYGMRLFHLFAERKQIPSLRLLEQIRLPYRDDNRFIWHFAGEAGDSLTDEMALTLPKQIRRYVSPIELANEVDCELAGDDAQEIWVCATPFYPYEDNGVSYNELFGKAAISEPYHLPEWDYQSQLSRPDWVTLYERRQERDDPTRIDDIMLAYKSVSYRIKQIIDLLAPRGVVRERHLEDGDEVDLNRAIEAHIALRMGNDPDPRMMMRQTLKSRDLAVVVLLDLSESTNECIGDSNKTVLELTREAATLVATAIHGIGDPFAIHGFASNGRHDVHYYRYKDFTEAFNHDVKARLAGMTGGLSTRMGAAMRHAGQHLLKCRERRKLLLVVTDGAPSDVDERDPQYLRYDSKKAVDELRTNGVLSYCLTLDPYADHYVRRIFGLQNYTVIDHVDRLPEQLPTLFASLTK